MGSKIPSQSVRTFWGIFERSLMPAPKKRPDVSSSCCSSSKRHKVTPVECDSKNPFGNLLDVHKHFRRRFGDKIMTKSMCERLLRTCRNIVWTWINITLQNEPKKFMKSINLASESQQSLQSWRVVCGAPRDSVRAQSDSRVSLFLILHIIQYYILLLMSNKSWLVWFVHHALELLKRQILVLLTR